MPLLCFESKNTWGHLVSIFDLHYSRTCFWCALQYVLIALVSCLDDRHRSVFYFYVFYSLEASCLDHKHRSIGLYSIFYVFYVLEVLFVIIIVFSVGIHC